jgi:sec-independent protein translocase protein TatB
MLPGMGGFEAVIIALLALVIVGPKDLPVLMRKLARWVSKVRGMAAEFRMSFDELARQSELDELRREVEALRRGDPLNPVRSELDPIARDINAGVNNSVHDTPSIHDTPSVTDRNHAAFEAAVAEANGESAAAADPYTPSFESTPAPTPTPVEVEAAPPAAVEPEPAPLAAEIPAPAAKPGRRKAKAASGAASVAGGEA